MWQRAHALGQAEPAQDRPAQRIQTIAAHFFARKFFAIEQDDVQSGPCAKGRAARAGRAAADYGNVVEHT